MIPMEYDNDSMTVAAVRLAIESLPKEYAVDIGCSYNSFLLSLGIKRNLFIEADPEKLKQIPDIALGLKKCIRVDCQNIFSVFEEFGLPEEFTFMNLDIDSFDFILLQKILTRYHPVVISTEINEKIPPPIKFFVNDEKHSWGDSSIGHFYGYSIACLDDVPGYDIAGLAFNNAILIRSDLNTFEKLTPEQAYREGYLPSVDRKDAKSYNYDMYPALDMTPQDAITFINRKFFGDAGKYSIGL